MNLSADETRSRFTAARVARLATASTAHQPHLVPVVFTVDGDVVYTAIDHKPKTTRNVRRLANIRANPLVTLLADEYDENWTNLWWARADGVAKVVENPTEMTHPIDQLVEKYEQYQQTRPQGPLIVIAVRSWQGWSWQ